MLTRTAACLARDFVVVGTVKDGRAALEAAGTLQPDVIVLDVSMPRMTGIEVAARLKAAGSKTAVVFLTVHSEEDVVQAARDAGGVGYVYKPRFASELLVAAREASTGHRFLSANIPRHLW
jgi:DNA-binding NarL/FixJ family response regulator